MGRLKNKKARVDLSRPSVDLTPTNRLWANITADDLQPGDIIAGMGLVQSKTYTTDPHHVMLSVGVEPTTKIFFFNPEEVVFAFVPRKD